MLDLPVLAAGTVSMCFGAAVLSVLRRARPIPLSATRALRKESAARLQAEQDRDEAQAEVIDLRWGLDEANRKFKAECRYVERLLAERDLAAGQAKFWAGESAKTTRLMIEMGAARDAAASPARPDGVVVRPVFGRRRPTAPTLPGPAA